MLWDELILHVLSPEYLFLETLRSLSQSFYLALGLFGLFHAHDLVPLCVPPVDN